MELALHTRFLKLLTPSNRKANLSGRQGFFDVSVCVYHLVHFWNLQVKYRSLNCLRRSNEVNITLPSGLKESVNCAVKYKYGQWQSWLLKTCLSSYKLVVGGSKMGGVKWIWSRIEQSPMSAKWGPFLSSDFSARHKYKGRVAWWFLMCFPVGFSVGGNSLGRHQVMQRKPWI